MKQKILFAAIMGSITTGLVSLTVIAANRGFVDGFIAIWLKSWLISYLVAVPSIIFIAPKVQYLVNYISGNGRDNGRD
jgi:predicted Co/Zn/Cd cation transporter (cation efflux family)